MDTATWDSIRTAELVLADLDGCLAAGNRPLPGAAEFAAALGERLWVVSNNSTEDAQQLSALLRASSLAIPPERILLAGELAVALVAERWPGAGLLLAGSATLATHARAAGLQLTQQEPDVVLLARDLTFSYAKLQRIAIALAAGAELVAANPDLTHPGAGGEPVPETGALLAAVRAVAPAGPEPLVVGKPGPLLYRAALRRAGVADPSRALMIGDNPTTDLAGAEALGMPGLLVGPAPGATVPALADLLPRTGAAA
ncbi:Haloacid Dehalogenase Superfamily Class (subfamily) IIA [Tistlia consotensis]|uniref:Haloacid Dehalogenase Superfamily Class (Subfamily) IIA n=1 Tax=Tistlia consotensis USBA 355 TaxID=560819 RepID=A0A1Y6CUB1_9PROT|nr:HAD-IIA family hydrolase [Tistlia consotensis]SMF78479.1 Haloacid Dehalogenase Superfamily Class (subfamily) IIA [Tistlia consotensis USBA 355]SNS18611.1 Haloacid Dehalogenase Superfamily Class (subfamily) IIA [Tistlia consotensis]